MVPGALGGVLVDTSNIEVVLMFKIIAGLCLGSGTVLFTWEGL